MRIYLLEGDVKMGQVFSRSRAHLVIGPHIQAQIQPKGGQVRPIYAHLQYKKKRPICVLHGKPSKGFTERALINLNYWVRRSSLDRPMA